MKWEVGNIFDYWAKGNTIVIPTNVGWTVAGRAIMGKGIAKQAVDNLKEEFDLPLFYGACCRLHMPAIYLPNFDMILVPTKSLRSPPHSSWRYPSDWNTVRASLRWLQKHAQVFKAPIIVPLLGAGCGQLPEARVMEVMEEYLFNPRFIGIQQPLTGGRHA